MSIKYELSRWNDCPAANGLREEKAEIIAATNMDFVGRAQNIVLKKEYNGRLELTFEIPLMYIDKNTGKKVRNKFVDNIIEKSKIKLWRDELWWNSFGGTPTEIDGNIKYPGEWVQGRWYDFIVKNHKEKRNKKELMYSYTCESLFINELARTGYDLEFVTDTDVMASNGMGTAHDLAKRIVDGTDWTYVKTETFSDYEEVFDPEKGITEKKKVSTDQIEFIPGLERYGYCYELVVDSEINRGAIENEIERQLIQQKIDIDQVEYGFDENNNQFFWKQ